MDDPQFDLAALAADLAGQGRHARLVGSIERALFCASAHNDLHAALKSIKLLRQLTAPGGMPQELTPENAGSIVAALLSHAIILYARATDTTPIKRRPWFGVGKLPADHRSFHALVIHLRNKELAHFGHGALVDGDALLAETLVLRPQSGSPINYHASRRHNTSTFVRQLEELLTLVTALARERSERGLDAVFAELRKVMSYDNSMQDCIARHPVSSRLRMMKPAAAAEAGQSVVTSRTIRRTVKTA